MTGASLDRYRAKRDFKATDEPRGHRPIKAKTDHGRFVVQKHDARRLHYDFRLEMDGVLKSWAVTRGPSLDPAEKRLAVHVEDHPLAYGDFEGTIPKGQYGGGSVIVWDRGTWSPLEDPRAGYEKGHLSFRLEGEKLHGGWHLVRIKGRRGERRDNWLLMKADDEAAQNADAPDILDEAPLSVKSGRSNEEVAANPDDVWTTRKAEPARPKAAKAITAETGRKERSAPLPPFVEPCLARLEAEPPVGPNWLHEVKFDGYRLQARIDRGKTTLITRTGLDWTKRFGRPLAAAFDALPVRQALIDGEVVVERGDGTSDFSALQAALSDRKTDPFRFFAFDLLHLDGRDLRSLPLAERKALLEPLFPANTELLRFSAHFEEDGGRLLRHACDLSLEGLVSKRRDAPYRSGRTGDWIKSKCADRQEFIVIGFVPSKAKGRTIGSLVAGYHDQHGTLRYAGRIGTGFPHKVAAELHDRLTPLARDKRAVAERLTAAERRGVTWVRPHLVAEVEFRGWTGDGRLRHAAFHGLREDKNADDVVREDDATPPDAVSGEPRPDRSAEAKASPATTHVKLTHPDRVYWPDPPTSKADLAAYYTAIWDWAAPHLQNRPLSLRRCPGGIDDQCFFQKHAWAGMNRAIRLTPDPKGSGHDDLVHVDDLDGLIGLVQAGVLEIHPWGSTLDNLERPDRLIFDLDPGEDVAWKAVTRAAAEVHERLETLKLGAFLKTTGGKGLHVVVPLTPRASWAEAKAFAKAFALTMENDAPGDFVATATKAKRGGRIFVDYLRNAREATAVAAYSTRSRPGAPVSAPLRWDELGVRSDRFRLANIEERLAGLTTDPWADFDRSRRPLPKL